MAKDDDWTGSMKKPWLNPPMKHDLGARRGSWWVAMLVIGVAVAAVVVILVLVSGGHLARGWAYVALPVAIVAAALSRVLTIFKAAAEDKETGPDGV